MSVKGYATKAAREAVLRGKVWTRDELIETFKLQTTQDKSVVKTLKDWKEVFRFASATGWSSTLGPGCKPVRDSRTSKLSDDHRAKMDEFAAAIDKLIPLFGGVKESQGRGAKPFDMLSMFDDDDAGDDDAGE